MEVLREGFAGSGDDVTECNVPLGLDTAARVRILQRPWLGIVLLVRILRSWVRLVAASRRLPRPDVVVVGYLGHFDVHLARRLHRGVPLVLDHLIALGDTALDRGVRRGRVPALLDRIDAAALRAADVVVVDTDDHRAQLPVAARRRAVVVGVGASRRWFADPPAPVTGSAPLSVVFFGLFTPLQGTPAIGDALRLMSDSGVAVRVTMIGKGQDLAECAQRAAGAGNVTWLDWVEPDALPALVAAHDVCLGIFGTSPKALRVVPTKVFQGAAAGCAVVTSDTAPQRRALGTAACFVPPGDAAALAAALVDLAQDRRAVERLRGTARAQAEEHFRAEVVVAPLREHLATARRR